MSTRSLSALVSASCLLLLVACGKKGSKTPDSTSSASSARQPAVVAAKVPSGFLKELPWLLGTFRGTGVEGTKQAPFFERYSLADDSTLIVESFKDSTLTGPIDTTRYEARRDSLSNPGTSRYVATAISAKSVTFGPLVGVKNGFTWRKSAAGGWYAVITPMGSGGAKERTYRMARIK